MSRLSAAATDTSNAVDAPFGDARASQRLAGLLVEVARSLNRDLAPLLPSRLDGDPQLDALRSLLLEHDRAALAALQRKMDDPQQFAEAISAVLAHAFTLAETRGELAKSLFRHSLTLGPNADEGTLMKSMQVALVARHYERIADHAVTIAERVMFMVTGRHPGEDHDQH